jgi:hypothetical protein
MGKDKTDKKKERKNITTTRSKWIKENGWLSLKGSLD